MAKPIIPAEVFGTYKRNRKKLQIILILIFFILPLLKIRGQQALLLNFAKGHFYFFGVVLFSHDIPLFFFIVALFVLGVAVLTTAFGRAWCGWACPQTVFIDSIFRQIEILTEGSHLERRRQLHTDVNFQSVRRKTLKWLLFTIASNLIATCFISYFVGTESIQALILYGPASNWSLFFDITSITLMLLFNFGRFREQFCIEMCPYGRFQSVLQDSSSLTVAYDKERGEPRRIKGVQTSSPGDCVNCHRCVQVCPMGIDIRDGSGQMECINCTSCIDACNDVMKKMKKPSGLIRYMSTDGSPPQFLRPRVSFYLILMATLILSLSYRLSSREALDVFILHANETPYSIVKNENGENVVLNHFRISLKNQTSDPMTININENSDWKEKGLQLISPENNAVLPPGGFKVLHSFISVPQKFFETAKSQNFLILINRKPYSLNMVGPKK